MVKSQKRVRKTKKNQYKRQQIIAAINIVTGGMQIKKNAAKWNVSQQC